jgi:hypothetical protein
MDSGRLVVVALLPIPDIFTVRSIGHEHRIPLVAGFTVQGAIDVATDWEIGRFQGYIDVLLEQQAVCFITQLIAEVLDLIRHPGFRMILS